MANERSWLASRTPLNSLTRDNWKHRCGDEPLHSCLHEDCQGYLFIDAITVELTVVEQGTEKKIKVTMPAYPALEKRLREHGVDEARWNEAIEILEQKHQNLRKENPDIRERSPVERWSCYQWLGGRLVITDPKKIGCNEHGFRILEALGIPLIPNKPASRS